MKKNLFSLLSIFFVAALCAGFASCGGGDDDDDGGGTSINNNQQNTNGGNSTNNNQQNTNGSNYNAYETEMVNKLTRTSWHLWKTVTVYNNNESAEETRYVDATISFASNEILYYNNVNLTYKNLVGEGSWYFNYNQLWLMPGTDIMADFGGLGGLFGNICFNIQKIDDSQMILTTATDSKTQYDYFSKVAYIGQGGTGNDNNGGTSSEDAPYITNFNSTSTKNSITVKFMSSERPISATIYYGEYSANKVLTTTISIKQISATATGLKSGTKYYFKCVVRNENGSSTSREYPAMTNY